MGRKQIFETYETGSICWGECIAVDRDPQVMNGAWCFAGTAVPLARLFEATAEGASLRDFTTRHAVKSTDPATVFEFLSDSLNDVHEKVWRHGGPYSAKPPYLRGGPQHRAPIRDPRTTRWDACPAASRDAEKMSGQWCIDPLRFPLAVLFGNLASGMTIDEFDDMFGLQKSEIEPILKFLAEDLGELRNENPE